MYTLEQKELADKYLLVGLAHAATNAMSKQNISVSVLGGKPTPAYWPIDVDTKLYQYTDNAVANIERSMVFFTAAKEVLETGKTEVLLYVPEHEQKKEPEKEAKKEAKK